jgi:predicted ATPase
LVYPDTTEQAAALAHHWAVAGDPEKELYYAEIAGHQAAENNANEEAINYFERALELLLAQPETGDRNQRELALLTGLGPPLMALRGSSAPEVMRVYARARELTIQTGQFCSNIGS